MQIICSLLNLQEKYIHDAKAMDIFKDTQNRIRSMALTHEFLYQTEEFANIDFEKYIEKLISNLFYFLNADREKIKMELQLEKIHLNIGTAIPCGLILNELLSNCLRHAFIKNGKGKIGIDFKLKDNNSELIVKDDGVGLPAHFDVEKSDALGLKLVGFLVQQLSGTYEIISGAGTEVRIKFPQQQQA